MNEHLLLNNQLILGAVVFVLGLIGFLVRRNIIVMFLCAEMMLQGVSLSLVAWSRVHNDWGGQMLVAFIIAVAACEAGIALVLILVLCQRSGSLDMLWWQSVREDGQDAYVDQEVPEETAPAEVWPRLTPAGVKPEPDLREEMYRTHV
jgi:NADH-quinone oxidoreductase subunit K